MKVTGLRCPCTPEMILPVDHYETGCENPPMHPRKARRLLRSLQEDEAHAAGNITVTRLLGCARQTIIEDFVGANVDLRDFNAIAWGLAMEAWIREEGAPSKVRLKGTLFGVEVSGEPDEINGVVEDFKVHNAITQQFTVKEPPKRELMMQLNLYRILWEMQDPEWSNILEQYVDYPPVKAMAAWHMANTPKNSNTPADYYQPVPVMSVKEIGEARPLGGGYTVIDIASTLDAAVKEIKSGKDPVEVAKSIPLMGESMRFGKNATKCDYCGVKRECWGLEGRRVA